jgi:exopolysaccharide production protein ExoY
MVFANPHDKVGLPAEAAPASHPVGGSVKRALDIATALTALVLLAPLLALVSLLVQVSMGRPILCRQARIGFAGREFGCYRFRTTAQSANESLPNDAHVTSLGRLLEASGIDQLPQLLNVLKGDMSCVGPRPLVPAELQRHAGDVGPCMKARPGMTGICQGRQRDTLTPDDQVALDNAYVHNWSMQGDIIILLKAIPAVARIEDRA